MQNGPMSAALAWARSGWRQVAAIVAALVLAIALLASGNAAQTAAAADSDAGDGTEQVVAGMWSYGDDASPWKASYPVPTNYSTWGPSWS